jgi:hypothetical protein
LPIALGCRHQHANSSYPARLLRPCRKRPRCCRASEHSEKFPPTHVSPSLIGRIMRLRRAL